MENDHGPVHGRLRADVHGAGAAPLQKSRNSIGFCKVASAPPSIPPPTLFDTYEDGGELGSWEVGMLGMLDSWACREVGKLWN